MQTLIDNLVFPAPPCSYSAKELQGRLVFIPKFKHQPKQNPQKLQAKGRPNCITPSSLAYSSSKQLRRKWTSKGMENHGPSLFKTSSQTFSKKPELTKEAPRKALSPRKLGLVESQVNALQSADIKESFAQTQQVAKKLPRLFAGRLSSRKSKQESIEQQETWEDSEEALIQMKKHSEALNEDDFIPCLFLKGPSDKVMVHFHANGEDIALTQQLMFKIIHKCRVNVLCVEFPGYGLYKLGTGSRSKQINQDAETVYRWLQSECSLREDQILVSGRSIGSGPATHLASKFNPACLSLISPIKSVKEVAALKYGRIADFLIEERFDNFSLAGRVKCPTVIFHGLHDTMVPYQHSLEFLMEGFKNCSAHLFLRDGMEHNRFDYSNDIVRPLRFFLKQNNILSTSLPAKYNKNVGYLDRKAIELQETKGIKNKSQYFNNVQARFKPTFQFKSATGQLLDHSFETPKAPKPPKANWRTNGQILKPPEHLRVGSQELQRIAPKELKPHLKKDEIIDESCRVDTNEEDIPDIDNSTTPPAEVMIKPGSQYFEQLVRGTFNDSFLEASFIEDLGVNEEHKTEGEVELKLISDLEVRPRANTKPIIVKKNKFIEDDSYRSPAKAREGLHSALGLKSSAKMESRPKKRLALSSHFSAQSEEDNPDIEIDDDYWERRQRIQSISRQIISAKSKDYMAAHETTVEQVNDPQPFVPREISSFMSKNKQPEIIVKDSFFQLPSAQLKTIRLKAREKLDQFQRQFDDAAEAQSSSSDSDRRSLREDLNIQCSMTKQHLKKRNKATKTFLNYENEIGLSTVDDQVSRKQRIQIPQPSGGSKITVKNRNQFQLNQGMYQTKTMLQSVSNLNRNFPPKAPLLSDNDLDDIILGEEDAESINIQPTLTSACAGGISRKRSQRIVPPMAMSMKKTMRGMQTRTETQHKRAPALMGLDRDKVKEEVRKKLL